MLRILWEKLSTTIWFIPTLIAMGLVALAFGLVSLDLRIDSYSWSWVSVLQIGSSGVRQVLAVTTGAMMSITGVLFSISVVALTLAANQFGPKILRNYLRDSKNKVMLGLLVGSFLFGLVVLASIDDDSSRHIPVFAFMTSMVLVVLAVGALIYFIHNISTSIQADQVIALIGKELNQTIDRTLHELDTQPDTDQLQYKWDLATHSMSVVLKEPLHARTSGYVEWINLPRILKISEEHDLHIELLLRSGDFIIEDSPLLNIYFTDTLGDSDKESLHACFSLGRQRTPIDDIEYAILQLLQIALRTLSPGINDSLTAISCIDWLSASLGSMAKKDFPPEYVEDETGAVRVKKLKFNFTRAADAMFHPLRQNSRGNEMVMLHLLETISRILQISKKKAYSDVLIHHAELIMLSAKESFHRESDRTEAVKRFEKCQLVYERSIERQNQLAHIEAA